MKNPYKRLYAEINLDNIVYNFESSASLLDCKVKKAAVVKADAYGHGAEAVALALSDHADFFCVSTQEEALQIEKYCNNKPIMLLAPLPGDDYDEIVSHKIRPCIYTLEQAYAVSDAAVKCNNIAHIHIAIDTGMNRIGMRADEESLSIIKKIYNMPHIDIEGIFTHMYAADISDLSSARRQCDIFRTFVRQLDGIGIKPAIRHISNSAGTLNDIGTDFDMVRIGISMYGIYPSDEVNKENAMLYPAMSIRTMITYVKTINAGEIVSYGGTYIADSTRKIATVPIGYADGYPRSLSNKGYILVDGKRAPIVGRICMDQTMIDVTDIPASKIGMIATVVGKDGADEIKVEDLSDISGRFPYEFICDISKRVPRIFIRNDRIIGTKDYFTDYYEFTTEKG